jgi:hypothetical protein
MVRLDSRNIRYNTRMELPRLVILLLALIWAACFVAFVVGGFLAFGSGTTFEYRVHGVQFPYAAALLLLCMATSSGLLWANYRNDDFRISEQIVYGALFGISVFGLILVVPLVLMA